MPGSTEIRPPTLTLAALSGAMLSSSLAISIAAVALPTLTRAFSATVSDVQWVVLTYLTATTVAVVPAGRLGDLIGDRKTLISGLFLYSFASLFCAAAPNLALLVAGRFVQGLGGAALMAIPISLARRAVPKERLGSAMGLMATTSAVGTALGPSLGGATIVVAGWRAAFMVLAAIGVLSLGLTLLAVPPKSRSAGGSIKQLDLPGSLLLVVAVAAYGILMSGPRAGIATSPGTLGACVVAAAMLFVIVETRSPSPLVPLRLLRGRKTGPAFVLNMVVATVILTPLVVGPFYLALVLELNELWVGLIMTVGPATSALTGVAAGRITDRFGAGRIVVVGLIQAAVGFVLLAFLPRLIGAYGYVMALLAITPGYQLFLAANNTAIMTDASDDQRGRLSGLLGLSRNLGFVTGASAIPALFAMTLDSGEIAKVLAHAIADAFTKTSLVASGLSVAAVVLAIVVRSMDVRSA